MSSFPEMEVKATVALDSGDGGTRRACNNENCLKDHKHEGPCSDELETNSLSQRKRIHVQRGGKLKDFDY